MSEQSALAEWLRFPDTTKLNIYQRTGRQCGLSAVAVEKDWWAVHTLRLIFSMECAPALVFKGGTSLSKGWNLIERFSEDIDLALDRTYLGFEVELSKQQIKRLRKASRQFMSTTFLDELKAGFTAVGLTNVDLRCRESTDSDQDPSIIDVYYPKLAETDTYLRPGLQIEVSSRSLKEPFTNKLLGTLVAEHFAGRLFADVPVTVPVVNPERTFLEKIFLLHEEFQKPPGKIRVDRLSRHLYDIEKQMQTPFADTALRDAELYNTVIAHRSRFASIAGIDYAQHQPGTIQFLPPDALRKAWQQDYQQMQENMIYGDSLSFDQLIAQLTQLQTRINTLQWN